MKFSDLDLHPSIIAGIEKLNFESCTPIQEAVIPHILQGKDIAGLAQTGTGKTAAFVVPLLDRILRSRDEARNQQSPVEPAGAEVPAVETVAEIGETSANGAASVEARTEKPTRRYFTNWKPQHYILVLVPTRELADQVCQEVEKLKGPADVKAVAVYGGTGYDKQIADIKGGADFIVGTPGRLIDLYKNHNIDFRQVRAVVFDEADRMFDMGFRDDMKYILQRIPKERQFLVFSATLNFDVLNIAYQFGADPLECNVSRDQAKAENVKDEIFHVGQGDKPQLLLSILRKENPKQVIVFSNFKHNVERIAKFMSVNGFPSMGISSLLNQNQRNRVMAQFKAENDKNILVATDVAARGLDIKGVDLVINYDLPDDPENYVHRIGRTGRAGQEGKAYSLVSDRDVDALTRVEDYLKHKISIAWLDDADLVKEYSPMPSDSRPPRGSGPRSDRPSRDGRRPDRGESHRSESRGGSRPEGRRGEGPRGERPRGEGRHEGRRDGSRRDESRREARRPERGARPDHASRGNGAEKTGEHRDRRSGRHTGRSSIVDNFAAQSRNERGERQERKAHGPRGRHQGRRHDHRGPRKPAPNKSLGQKVAGFFKRLFGS